VIPALLNGLTENGKSRVFPPALRQCWPHLLGDDKLTDLLKAGMGGGLGLKGKPGRDIGGGSFFIIRIGFKIGANALIW